jgi:hypothetical protein
MRHQPIDTKFTHEEVEKEIRYLQLLSKQFPTVQTASTEIINLEAVLQLPKGTEHFLSDIHGEHEIFSHVLRNGSGVIRQKIEDVFKNTLRKFIKDELATLIYYPEEKLALIEKSESDIEEWYSVTLQRLVEVTRVAASKYTRSKVRKSLPTDFAYIIEELLHEKPSSPNKAKYFDEIIQTIIRIDRAKEFIIAICKLIQRLSIDRLHIVGDIFDRGPAVENAYDELLPEKSFPSYFLFLEIDPAIIDVNIHPTKTEIKFEDEKIIYSVLKSAVKAALGKFSITPAIDFDVEPLFDFPTRTKDASTKQPTVGFNPDYNPFEKRQAPLTPRQISNRDNWDKMIPPKDFSFGKETDSNTDSVPKLIEDDNSDMAIQLPESNFLQLHRKYIITQVKSGLMIIDQQRAHERIMYERYLELLSKRVTISQQVLFGVKISLSAGDSELLNEIMEDLNLLGFNIKADKNKPFQYIAEGIPAGTEIENVPDTIDRILHNYKQGLIEFAQSKRVNLARSMAKNLSVKTGKVLQQAEMKTITEELFSCQAPEVSLDGEPTVKVININKYFNHKE